jgi:oligoendopeptidase F
MVPSAPKAKKIAKSKAHNSQPRWKLGELYTGPKDPKLERDFKALERGAKAFAKSYHGKVAKLDIPSLAKALAERERLERFVYRILIYANLEFATKSTDPVWGGFQQSLHERCTKATVPLEFFKVEWTKLSATKAGKAAADPRLARYRHYLEQARAFKPHTLSESEEVLVSRLGPVGPRSWVRYYNTVLADIEYKFKGKAITASELTGKVQDPDREVRKLASEVRSEGLLGAAKPLTFAFNMVLAGAQVGDEVRSYDHWVQHRNMDNEIPDKVVDALVAAVTGRIDLYQRYWRLKSKLMGLRSLMSYDIYAPLPGARQPKADYAEAAKTVKQLFADTRPSFGKIAEQMFAKQHVDVPPYQGKRSGAFCMPNMHGIPYVLLNWTGKRRDVSTLAHEFGHAVHMELSRKQGPLGAVESLVMAEVASVFMETLLKQQILAETKSPRQRLHMLAGIIEDGFATTFRQLQFNRFENAVHNKRREGRELSTEEISGLYREVEGQFFGNTMKPAKDAEAFWMAITHFVNVPGYVYAYCASYLIVLALYKRYLEEGKPFLAKYEKMLAAGGSQAPGELLAEMGVDWTDPNFWAGGLEVFEGYIDQLDTAAKELKLV